MGRPEYQDKYRNDSVHGRPESLSIKDIYRSQKSAWNYLNFSRLATIGGTFVVATLVASTGITFYLNGIHAKNIEGLRIEIAVAQDKLTSLQMSTSGKLSARTETLERQLQDATKRILELQQRIDKLQTDMQRIRPTNPRKPTEPD